VHMDQSFPFSPSWFPPSPEPFPQSMEFLQDPLMVEFENMDEVLAGSFDVPAVIGEAYPSTITQQPCCPESLTIPQSPPNVQEQVPPLSNSHGYEQQYDQQGLLNPNMLNSSHEPDVFTMVNHKISFFFNINMYIALAILDSIYAMKLINDNTFIIKFVLILPTLQQQQQPLSNIHGYLQQSDDEDLLQNMLNSFQEPNPYPMQEQQQLFCDDSHEHVQGNLPNIQPDQQYLSNENMTNSFQESNDSTMQSEEGDNGYAAHQQPMTDCFELPNHLEDMFQTAPVSENYPTYSEYQHGPIGSDFNMDDQMAPPRVSTNREDEHLAPRMVTDMAM
ncbi:hypothetical protein CARUB_v10012581mg, partial [Capsella rubella]